MKEKQTSECNNLIISMKSDVEEEMNENKIILGIGATTSTSSV